jgi:hypothetical protein
VVDLQKMAIKIGVTTRDEIIARAGEPDAVLEEQRIFAYSWEHANWEIDTILTAFHALNEAPHPIPPSKSSRNHTAGII